MTAGQCAECGASGELDANSCATRFHALLALDHSHQEPWGSRHGQAFAVFALQHPATYARSLDHAWASLYRIYVQGDAPRAVYGALIAHRGATPPEWGIPPRPAAQVRLPALTIADLGDFAAATYAERLDAWCRATLIAWGVSADALASEAGPS